MKMNEIMKSVNAVANKVCFKVQKHSPEILVVGGLIGLGASFVMACKASTKLNPTLEEAAQKSEAIKAAADKGEAQCNLEDGSVGLAPYSQEDAKKDIASTYIHTGFKIAKMYAPSVILGTLSVAAILKSNDILKKRNVALAAAYATVDKGFKEYRSRVIDRFGEEIDRQLKYNFRTVQTTETVTDENGNEKTVETVKHYADPNDVSMYARFFEPWTRDEQGNVINNPYWDRSGEYNLMFLKKQERYANDLLRSRGVGGRLFLNEVYDMLGLPRTKAGQVVGWIYDPDLGNGDSYVDFGLYKDNLNYSDFVYSEKEAILLDFNVDGNVWEDM